MERPAHPNAAFNVLAMALEAATGKNYTHMAKDMLSTNVGMKNTLPLPGCDYKGVIPSVESNWGTDFGYSAPWSCFYFFGSIEIRAQTSRPLSGSQSDPNPAMAQTRHIWREHIYRSWHAVGSRKQADHDCAHSFGTNCNGGNSSGKANITFKQEIDSLTISSFHLNGSDMLTSIPEMWNLTMGQYSSPVGPKLRLFPSDMVKQTKVQHETLTSEMWLLWPELIDGERSDLPGAGLEHANCMTWAIGDWVHYGGQPIDRVLFYRDENGKVVGFEAPFLRTGILRP